ncbi:MAG: hypothetical protein WAW36_19035 [Methylovulum miyakonense]|uniref:hypothetical protein n=1 Tax=Methylovulum miyakonense TaxID=645578 RepID=UPI003BB60530
MMGYPLKNNLPGQAQRPQFVGIRQVTELLGLNSVNYAKRFVINRDGFPTPTNADLHKNPDLWQWLRTDIIQYRNMQREANDDVATA